MLLTIDMGNTNIEFGLYDLTKKDLLGTFRLMTKGSQTSDEIGLTLCDYLNRFGWQPEQIEDVIIASVVPGIMYSLKNAMVKYLGRRPLVINEDVFAELGYLGGATTNEHGADRSVACMAAVEKYGAPLLVLDFGTATTIEAHVLDYSADLYGRRMGIAFVKRLRDERKFRTPAELASQLRHDIGHTREALAASQSSQPSQSSQNSQNSQK